MKYSASTLNLKDDPEAIRKYIEYHRNISKEEIDLDENIIEQFEQELKSFEFNTDGQNASREIIEPKEETDLTDTIADIIQNKTEIEEENEDDMHLMFMLLIMR